MQVSPDDNSNARKRSTMDSSNPEITEDILWPDLEISTSGSAVVEFLENRSVFVTGATGFFGKILVEKLLRTCESLDTVYVLVRPKKGKDIHTRIDNIYGDVVFSQLAKKQPKFRHKIVAIKGDAELPGLGISDSDLQLITEKVSVIYHAAATVRFDEKLKTAVGINVLGTKAVLELARKCPKLVSMVHVSTAFSNCPRRHIDEVFYEPPITTDKIAAMVRDIPEKELDRMTPGLLGEWPNTYAFTKAIAEETVEKYGLGLPICVLRPSIVIATEKEPLRGWIDNVYGPTGVLVAVGTGILRTLHCNPNVCAEMVPVDKVVNALIVCSYRNAIAMRSKSTTSIPIYNYVSSAESPITWDRYMRLTKDNGMAIPTSKAVYYYSFTLNKNWYVNFLYNIFLHMLPAMLIDAVLFVAGRTPVAVKLYNKVNRFSKVISYFSTQEWTFANSNVRRLWGELGEDDQRVFPFTMDNFDWVGYCKSHIVGVRVFLVKDGLETVPEAKKKWTILAILHYTLKFLFFAMILKLLYSLLKFVLALA